MKLKPTEEKKGNLKYGIEWVSISGRTSHKKEDTEEEAIKQIMHLISLGYKPRQICVYVYQDMILEEPGELE